MLQLRPKELHYKKCRGLQIVSIVFCNYNLNIWDYVQPFGHMILRGNWVCSLNLVHTIISHRPNLNSRDVHCLRRNQWNRFQILGPFHDNAVKRHSVNSSRWIYAIISKYIESRANLMLKMESSCKNSPGTKFLKWFGWREFGVYGDKDLTPTTALPSITTVSDLIVP